MRAARVVVVWALLLANLASVFALYNGLGLTPQMGWNSWNHYGCDGYNYTTIKDTADAFFTQGLYQAGYRYVNLDDCWSARTRDANGQLQPDPEKFPADQDQSLQDLIDYIHSQGLLFGLYSDAGRRTCARHDPGSLRHEEIDAQTWASWEVDYLKYDNCNSVSEPLERYPPMRDALNATGRPIFYSLCEWGRESVPTWGRAVGNSWRTTGDISDNWHSMLNNLYGNNDWADYGGIGGWNDPDMLEVGNGGMTNTEYTSHFSLWALMKSPMIIGCDVINMDSDTRTILTNTEVIAVNQDPRGIQGKLIRAATNTTEIWGGPLQGGDYAVVLFNKGDSTASITLEWTDLNILTYVACLIRDLWAHSNLGLYTSSFTAQVESHGVVMLRVIPTYSSNYVYYSNSTQF